MELHVLNEDFERVCVVDVFQSLIWADRYYKYGDFELLVPIQEEVVENVLIDNYVMNTDSDKTMIVNKLTITSDAEDGTLLQVDGTSLESILTRRIVWTQTKLDGNFQNGVERLLNDAIINPTDPKRKIENFVFKRSDDPAITSLTVDTQFTGDNLYDAIQSMCMERGCGFRVRLNLETKQLEFELYMGVDYSYRQNARPYVVFAPSFDNIVNTNYFCSVDNYKNITLVAGEGEGADRKMAVAGDEEASGILRRELYTDARDLSTTKEDGNSKYTDAEYRELLVARGVKKLLDYGVDSAFEGETDATQSFNYGKDFYMGDIVQTDDGYGHQKSSRIIEYIMSQDDSGITKYPTFEEVSE